MEALAYYYEIGVTREGTDSIVRWEKHVSFNLPDREEFKFIRNLCSLINLPDHLTEEMMDDAADAYHQARLVAIEKARKRNEEIHIPAGRGSVAKEMAAPVDWLPDVYQAILSHANESLAIER